jgi:hypothetical protein
VENLEHRELMAADFMALPLDAGPLIHPADVQPLLDNDLKIELNPDIFDDLGPLLPLIDPFVGTWTNVDPFTGGVTQIQITSDASGHHIEAWGACVPTDCEWGKVDLDLLGTSVSDNTPDYAIGQWDPGFKDATITLEVMDGGLIADLYNVYKDDSGRQNFHQRYRLTDSGDLMQVYTLGDEQFGDMIIGGWVNEDPDTRGLTKLTVADAGANLEATAWGACTPTDCEWGAVPMHTIGTSIADTTPEQSVASWDHGFSTVFVTTHVAGSELIVERYTVFHDGSDRSNYYSQESMWKLGDSNHDGFFNSSDLVLAFASGEYEDDTTNNSTWEEGDWNRDGEFDSADIVEAMQSGGYEASPLVLDIADLQLPELIPLPGLPFELINPRLIAIDEALMQLDFNEPFARVAHRN